MDNETSSTSISSIKSRIDALRNNGPSGIEEATVSEETTDKKFSFNSSSPIEEGVVTMSQDAPTTNDEDGDAESNLEQEFQSLHQVAGSGDTAGDAGNTPTKQGVAQKTKFMLAAGVAALGLLAYGASVMMSAVKSKKEPPVSLTLQSAKAAAPLLAPQQRMSSASVQPVSTVAEQTTQIVVAPTVGPAPTLEAQAKQMGIPTKQLQPVVVQPTKPMTKMQAAQLRALPQVVTQQPQAPIVVATATPAPQAEPVKKIEDVKKAEKPEKIEKPRKAHTKKKKAVSKKRKSFESDMHQQENISKSSNDVLAILERARNSQ